jgi:two-component system response regulator HydG
MGRKNLRLSDEAKRALCEHSWPGNVRELQNCVERAVALTRHEEILVEDLPERIRAHTRRPALESDAPCGLVSLAEVERRHIAHVLGAVGGNKTLAARILGLDRKTLYRKLDRQEERRS